MSNSTIMKHSRRGETRQKYWWLYIIHVFIQIIEIKIVDHIHNQNYRRKG